MIIMFNMERGPRNPRFNSQRKVIMVHANFEELFNRFVHENSYIDNRRNTVRKSVLEALELLPASDAEAIVNNYSLIVPGPTSLGTITGILPHPRVIEFEAGMETLPPNAQRGVIMNHFAQAIGLLRGGRRPTLTDINAQLARWNYSDMPVTENTENVKV